MITIKPTPPDADLIQELHREAIQAKEADRMVSTIVAPRFTNLTEVDLIEKSKISYPTIDSESFKKEYASIYIMIHRFLNKHYLKKGECDHCKSKDKRKYEFALIKGKDYSYNRNDYIVLCVSCHKSYDNSEYRNLKISQARKRELQNGTCAAANRYKGKFGADHNCSIPICKLDRDTGAVLATYDSLASAQRIDGYNASAICNAISGKNKTSYGFKWIKAYKSLQP